MLNGKNSLRARFDHMKFFIDNSSHGVWKLGLYDLNLGSLVFEEEFRGDLEGAKRLLMDRGREYIPRHHILAGTLPAALEWHSAEASGVQHSWPAANTR